ncbi:magnesium chelatase subunit D [Burkholderiales bacterium]
MTLDDLDCLVSAWLSPSHSESGLWVRGSEGPSRQALMAVVARHAQSAGLSCRRLPARLNAEALDPQMDLAQTLGLGRVVMMPGLLGASVQAVLVLPMAERQPIETLQRLGQAMDLHPLKLLVLDESLEDEPALAPVLADRMGLGVDLRDEPRFSEESQQTERTSRLASDVEVAVPDELARQAAGLLMSMAIFSFRPLQACLRLMRSRARWCGRVECHAEDLAWSLAFTAVPHARVMPSAPPPDAPAPSEAQDEPTDAPPESSDPSESDAPTQDDYSEQVLEVLASQALLPDQLLKALVQAKRDRRPPARREGGRQGQRVITRSGRGVRMGLLRQAPRDGRERIAWLPSLRAALPLQRFRQARGRLSLRLDDLHIYRVAHRRPVTTVFLVDASGSMAMSRLNEAKGAVELLLADCYVRRDRVALISVGGLGAQLLLPPTRSLTAAKRALLAMPGGGGSPLGAGLALAHRLLLNISRAGEDSVLVLLTDGRANLSRDGVAGRERAQAECLQLAKPLILLAQKRLVIDGSVRPEPAAQRLAEGLRGHYVALPHVRAEGIHAAIQSATQ